MAVAIRLSRQGSKKRPFYRIVAAEKSSPRDGRFIELLGTYDPRTKDVQFKLDRYTHWLASGALPSQTVASLYRRSVRQIEAEDAAAAVPAKAKPAKAKAPKAPAAEAKPAQAPAQAADAPAQAADEPAQAAPADAE